MQPIPYFARDQYRQKLVKKISNILAVNKANCGIHHIMKVKEDDLAFWWAYKYEYDRRTDAIISKTEVWGLTNMTYCKLPLFLKPLQKEHLLDKLEKKKGLCMQFAGELYEYLYNDIQQTYQTTSDEYIRTFITRTVR